MHVAFRWDLSLTQASCCRVTSTGIVTEAEESKRQDGKLATGALRRPQHGSKTQSGTSSKEVAHRLAATGLRPPAGLSLELVHLETAGGIPHDLASKPATSRPDEESWDFGENEQDFGEEKNPPKPHANP
jgi:hypothetical protein